MIFFKKRKLARLLKKVEGLSHNRLTNSVSDSVLRREINLYKKLAALYRQLSVSKLYPFAKEQAIECLRLASSLGDLEAMRQVGQHFMEQGKFWYSLADTIFYDEAAHLQYQRACFDEAFTFLNTANSQDDILAKRLLGVLYVNGWGTDSDVDKGLKLIMQSLDMANEWPQSSVIFAELGLNKPEFFTKLMALKGG